MPFQRPSQAGDAPGTLCPASPTTAIFSRASSPSGSAFVFSLRPVASRKPPGSFCFCIRFVSSLVLFFLLIREYVDCHGSSVTSSVVKATPRSLPSMFPDLPFQPQIVGWSKSVLTKYCAPVLFAHSFSNHPKTSCGKEFCRAGTIEKCFLVFSVNPLPASFMPF